MAVAILRKDGFLVDAADDGKQALKMIEANHYDLILMDCQMPELDGYATTLCIRAHPDETKRAVPIVAMTAHAIRGDRRKMPGYGYERLRFQADFARHF